MRYLVKLNSKFNAYRYTFRFLKISGKNRSVRLPLVQRQVHLRRVDISCTSDEHGLDNRVVSKVIGR